MSHSDKKLGLWTTCAFVIANMVGVGVFTSLGYQLSSVPNKIAVLFLMDYRWNNRLMRFTRLWRIGSNSLHHVPVENIIILLKSIIHWQDFFQVGYPLRWDLSSGCCCLYGFGNISSFCLSKSWILSTRRLLFLISITAVHMYSIQIGSRFQNFFTVFKILLIIIFVFCGLTLTLTFQDFGLLFISFIGKIY